MWRFCPGSGRHHKDALFQCLTHVENSFSGDISSIVFSASKGLFVTLSNDFSIRVWSSATLQILSSVQDAHSSPIRGAVFHDSQHCVVTVSQDKHVFSWSLTPYYKIHHTPALIRNFVTCICPVKFVDKRSKIATVTVALGSVGGNLDNWNFNNVSNPLHKEHIADLRLGCVLAIASAPIANYSGMSQVSHDDFETRVHSFLSHDSLYISVSATEPRARLWVPLHSTTLANVNNNSNSNSNYDMVTINCQEQDLRCVVGLPERFPSGSSSVLWYIGVLAGANGFVGAVTFDPHAKTVRVISVFADDSTSVKTSGATITAISINTIDRFRTVLMLGDITGSVYLCEDFSFDVRPRRDQLRKFSFHSGGVLGVRALQVENHAKIRIASVSHDQQLAVFEVPVGTNETVKKEQVLIFKHKGSIRAVTEYERFIITASDCDGIKVWRPCFVLATQHSNTASASTASRSTASSQIDFASSSSESSAPTPPTWQLTPEPAYELLVELEEPCSALVVQGDCLFSAHGCGVLGWQLKDLLTSTLALQPLSGIPDSHAVSIVRVPYESNDILSKSQLSSSKNRGLNRDDDNNNNNNNNNNGHDHETFGDYSLAAKVPTRGVSTASDMSASVIAGAGMRTESKGCYECFRSLCNCMPSHNNSDDNTKNRGKLQRKNHAMPVTHLVIPQFKTDKWNSSSEWEQALLSLPWLCGLCLSAIARTTTSSRSSISHHQHRILSYVKKACFFHNQLFLDVDPVYKYYHNEEHSLGKTPIIRGDSLIEALRERNLYLVDFILYDLLGQLWLKQSMALIFNAAHVAHLLRTYPLGLVKFLRSDPTRISELCIERNPKHVTQGCERVFIGKPAIRGSFGMEPYDLWSQETRKPEFHVSWLPYLPSWRWLIRLITKLIKPRNATASEEVEGFRVGIKGALEHRKQLLNLANKVRPKEARDQVFQLHTISSLIRYEVRINKAALWFTQSILLHTVLVFVDAFFSLLATNTQRTNEENVVTNVFAVIVFVINSITFWEEAQQLYYHGLLFFAQAWNFLDGLRIVTTYLLIVGYVWNWRSRFAIAAVSVVCSWCKLVYYLRVFERFAFMVQAIFEILLDLREFLVILAIIMVGFANSFYILFRKSDNIDWDSFDPGSDFSTTRRSILSSYTMLLGTFDPRVFLEAEESVQILASFLFVIYMLFVFVIMLNVVIAIIGKTFERVNATKETHFHIERSDMVVEHNIGMDKRLNPHHYWIQLLASGSLYRDFRGLSPTSHVRVMLARSQDSSIDLRTLISALQSEVQSLRESCLAALPRASIAAKTLGRPSTIRRPSRMIRPSLAVSRAAVQIEKEDNKLDTPGPFGLVPTPLRLNVLSTGSRTFDVDKMGSHQFLSHLDDLGVLNVAQFSPLSPLVPPNADRQALDVPDEAIYFAIAFPLVGVGHIDANHKMALAAADSSFAFLLFGGILYFNDKEEIVGTHAFLVGGNDMQFREKSAWSHTLSRELQLMRRFQSVTLENLTAKGVVYYSWVNPAEEFGEDSAVAASGEDWKHGAFVYLFHSDVLGKKGHKYDCYFAVDEACPFAKIIAC